MSDIIDINVTPTIEEVTIVTTEFLTTINVNTNSGGGIPEAPINGELWGRKDADWEVVPSGYIPITGTEVGSPITGDLEFESDNVTNLKQVNANVTKQIKFEDDTTFNIRVSDNLTFNEGNIGVGDNNISLTVIDDSSANNSLLEINLDELFYSNSNPTSKGIIGNALFDKQSDPNAFAQLGGLPFANIQT